VGLWVVLWSVAAQAGGMGRPNIFSPLGLGIGGAGFAGVANPTTIHYNPAGLVLMSETVVLGGLELVMAPRRYEPLSGPVEENEFALLPAPSVGVSTRFASRGGRRPLPFALGLGFYNTFGGSMDFDPAKVSKGIVHTSMLLLELVPAAAYQINPRLSAGVGIRLGFGTFSLTSNDDSTLLQIRRPSELSGSGIHVGVSLGLTWEPLDWLRVGVTYASPMSIEMKGGAKVELGEGKWREDSDAVTAPWPQWAALGGTFIPIPSLLLHAGGRWTDWASFHHLVIDFSATEDITEQLNFDDGISLHLGAEWALHRRLTLRAGMSYDSNTVGDHYIRRQYLDADKLTAALGGSVLTWGAFTLDFAYEILFGPTREVPALSRMEPDTAGRMVEVKNAPGRYSSNIHSIALGLRYIY
jgi:long-chain fatty acid transport protein